MKVKKLLIGRLYKCTYPNREGEYVYVGEHLIGYCFNGCGGNRNIDIGSLLTKPGIRIFGRDITCNLIIGLKVTVFCKSVRHTVPQIPFFSQRTLPVNINRITVYLLTTDYRETALSTIRIIRKQSLVII